MTTTIKNNRLSKFKRIATALFAAVAICFCAILDVNAAGVTLEGSTTNSCVSYSAVTIASSGAIVVTCSGTVIPSIPPPIVPPPPPPVVPPTVNGLDLSGCPVGYVLPSDVLKAELGGFGNFLQQVQRSKQIVAIPLPGGTNISQQVTLSESPATNTPSPVNIEISINKCPGLILPQVDPFTSKVNYCSLQSSIGQINSLTWFAKPYTIIRDAESANQYGYCWAGDNSSPGKYYINARWTYTSCANGVQVCGWLITHNNGPF